MQRRLPTKVATLQPLQPHTQVSPSPSHTFERTARPYSPSVYSRVDNYSEYHYRPYSDVDEEPFPAFPDHLREKATSFYPSDDAHDPHILSADQNSPDEDLANGLSLMGPRMKMLSRAPWEVSSPFLEADEGPNVDEAVDNGSIFGRRSRSKTLTKAAESLKGFRRGGSKSHDTTEPSASTRAVNPLSNGMDDRTSILTTDPDPFGTSSRRPTWSSLPRARTLSSASTSHTDSVISSFAPSSSSSNVPQGYSPFSERFSGSQPPSPSLNSSMGSKGGKKKSDRPPSPKGVYDTATLSSIHPYANPDLYFPEGNPDTTPQPSFFKDQSHSLDTAPFSRLCANHSTSTIAGDAPIPTLTLPPSDVPSSPPLLPSTPSTAVPFPSGYPLAESPGFTLISLDQAREKVRNRARSGDQAVGGKIFGTRKAASSMEKLPSSAKMGPDEESSFPSDQVRSPKFRRSGFMRFFKEGKEKDGNNVPAVPPLPSGLRSRSRSVEPSLDDRRSRDEVVPPLPQSRGGSIESDSKLIVLNAASNSRILSNERPATSSTTSLDKITKGLELPGFASKFKKSPRADKKNPHATLEAPAVENGGFQALHLRPVSSFFSSGLPSDMLVSEVVESPTSHDRSQPRLSIPQGSVLDAFESSSTLSHQASSSATTLSTNGPQTPGSVVSPADYRFHARGGMTLSGSASSVNSNDGSNPALVEARKVWRIQAFEYEAQIRDLTAEIQRLRAQPCEECGGLPPQPVSPKPVHNVLDRPRPKLGGSSGSSFAKG